MTRDQSPEWDRYGQAVVGSMAGVLEEAIEEHHPVLLETADYWLSLGLTIALKRPDDARRLLGVIETEGPARAELDKDAAFFVEEVFG